jgi:hypothetical protein
MRALTVLVALVVLCAAADKYCSGRTLETCHPTCTHLTVRLDDAELEGSFDWGFLTSLTIIGNDNVIITGYNHTLPTKNFVSVGVTYWCVDKEEPLFRSAAPLEHAFVSGMKNRGCRVDMSPFADVCETGRCHAE